MKPAFDWLLLAFGAVLALVGLYWMWSGWDIIQIERGWVSVISGAIMLSGGVMVSALAYGVMTFRTALQGGAPERVSEHVRPPLPDVLRPRPPEAESASQESQHASQHASQRAPLRESLAAREGASPGLATPAIVAAAAAAGAAAVSQATKAPPQSDAPEGDLAAEARKESGAPSVEETPDDVALKEAAIEEALALPLDENPEPDSDEAQQEFDARVREAAATAAVGQQVGQEIGQETGQETGSLEDESRGFGRWFRRRPRAEPVETRPAPQPVAREQSDIDRALESELADALGLAPEKPVEAAGGFQAALDETARQERARREAAERESTRDADAMAAGDATAVEKKAGEKPDDETAEKHSAKLDEERAEAGTADEDAEVDLEIARELRRDAAPPPPALEAAPKPEPAILGRHTSGDTTYTMFADGSIEAETPDGIMRFDSLVELRRHVERSGEA